LARRVIVVGKKVVVKSGNIERKLESLISKHGFDDFKWIDPATIVVAEWVRMKCMYGCSGFGKNACCPPNTLPVVECRRFFDEYRTAAIFHFEKKVAKPEDRRQWCREINKRLLELERGVFLSGYHKAFLLFVDSCHLCAECANTRAECKNPKSARPAPEAMAVDVFATARGCGYPIEVLSEYSQAMNRYAFLLVE
jgi:predicted metal-binding protein